MITSSHYSLLYTHYHLLEPKKMMENTFVFTEPHLAQIHKDTQQIITELKGFESLTYQQLNWKPSPASWSVIECIEHLKITEKLYIEKITKALDDARIQSLKTQKPFKSSWLGKWFANQMKPNTRKIKNPALFAPATSTLDNHTLKDYIEAKTNFLTLLENLNGYDIQRMKISSPVTKLIVFRVGDAIQILTNHDFRHIQQIQRVIQNSNFPTQDVG